MLHTFNGKGLKPSLNIYNYEIESNAVESYIPGDPISAAKYFLNFIRVFLREASGS